MRWHDFTLGEDVYLAAAKRLYEVDGMLYWREGRTAGLRVATRATRAGHLTFQFDSRTITVHRMIWFLRTGSLPRDVLDHINDNPADNRFENLRDVSHRVNHRANKSQARETFSGLAQIEQRGDRWLVSGCVRGGRIRKVYLGSYGTEAEAIAAGEGADRLNRFLARTQDAAA
jgi:hypothetical protein